MAKTTPLKVEIDVTMAPNLERLMAVAKAFHDEQAANPDRTHLEQLIHSKFAISPDAWQPIRNLAQSIVDEGYRRPDPVDGVWTLTDAEMKQELGNEWEAGLDHALTWLGLKHYADVMSKDNPHGSSE